MGGLPVSKVPEDQLGHEVVHAMAGDGYAATATVGRGRLTDVDVESRRCGFRSSTLILAPHLPHRTRPLNRYFRPPGWAWRPVRAGSFRWAQSASQVVTSRMGGRLAKIRSPSASTAILRWCTRNPAMRATPTPGARWIGATHCRSRWSPPVRSIVGRWRAW